ncbi:hypothetical protein CAC42_3408 [Sphaceloma murrayae]|uniref:Apple domain-containing protein n=1 Tax=Sphaceloma murrayae TaxID=2082308 RepID=A0A2K1R1A7_9PEZI|nr:hypothetical protein CAC42_3408 [Sphaceloma murrayae]
MHCKHYIIAALAAVITATPAPAVQQFDLAQLAAAPSVTMGPAPGEFNQTVPLVSHVEVKAVTDAISARGLLRRGSNNIPQHGKTTSKRSAYKKTTTRDVSGKTSARKLSTASTLQGYVVPVSSAVSSAQPSQARVTPGAGSTTKRLVKPTWRRHSRSSKLSKKLTTSTKPRKSMNKAAKTPRPTTVSFASPINRHTTKKSITTVSSVIRPTTKTTISRVLPINRRPTKNMSVAPASSISRRPTKSIATPVSPINRHSTTAVTSVSPIMRATSTSGSPCTSQPGGYGPKVTPDTVDAFKAFAPFHSMASAAPTSVPSTEGAAYRQVFRDLDGTISAASYLGLHTLQTYNVAQCAALCDEVKLCTSFNIYIERDPSQSPRANNSTGQNVGGSQCPNPASQTNYKCTLWGSRITASQATNKKQAQYDFQIVFAGSNGYDKTDTSTPVVKDPSASPYGAIPSSSSTSTSPTSTPSSTLSSAVQPTTTPTVLSGSNPHWTSPQNHSAKAISAASFLTSTFIPGPFNPQLCADYAYNQTLANAAATSATATTAPSSTSGSSGGNVAGFTKVKFFNAYYLNKNGAPLGTVCALYGEVEGEDKAVYDGGIDKGDVFEVAQSWTWQMED